MSPVNRKKENVMQKLESEVNIFTKDSIKEIERKKLQDFYSSVLGKNPEEYKINSRVLRRKIYMFGIAILIFSFLFYFFILGKISFITA